MEIYLSHSGKVTHTFLLFLQNLLNIIAIDIILFFIFKYSSYEIICRKKHNSNLQFVTLLKLV